MTGTPGFTLRFEEKPDYLHAFVTGPKDSLNISNRFWAQIHSKVLELKPQAVVVEEDFPNQLSTMEMFGVAEFIAKTFGPKIKVAHVDRQISDMDLNRFGETVAVNRGFNVRVFNKFEDAEKWIRE